MSYPSIIITIITLWMMFLLCRYDNPNKQQLTISRNSSSFNRFPPLKYDRIEPQRQYSITIYIITWISNASPTALLLFSWHHSISQSMETDTFVTIVTHFQAVYPPPTISLSLLLLTHLTFYPMPRTPLQNHYHSLIHYNLYPAPSLFLTSYTSLEWLFIVDNTT